MLLLAGCATEPDPDPEPPTPPVDVTTLSCRAVPDACGAHGTVVDDSFASDRDIERRLFGVWRFCGGDDSGHLADGIELTRDRRLYFLTTAADGSCQRRDDHPGTWYVWDISEQNPAGTYQLVLDEEASVISLVPAFTAAPVVLVDGFFGFEFARLSGP